MTPRLLVCIPTWNNPEQLKGALDSLFATDFSGDLVIANNGDPLPWRSDDPWNLIHFGENLGWMGAINRMLALYDPAEHDVFCMLNDDVIFPKDRQFFTKLLSHFSDPKVGGVGPISNFVSGCQQARISGFPLQHETSLLIGFCALYRRGLLTDGLDESLPGGDDLDLSIRVRQAGYKLMVDRRAFLYHLGQQTGRRVHSDWDSRDHQMRTANAIIRKHGMRAWYDCITVRPPSSPSNEELVRGITELGAHIYTNGSMGKTDIVEGSSTYPELHFLNQRAKGAKRILEIGFNAGFSAYAMLSASPDVEVASVDERKWPCVDLAKDFMDRRFPDRHELHIGDSRTVVPTLTGSYDFAFIDGGHEYETALADMRNCLRLTDTLIVDDIGFHMVERAWEQLKSEGKVVEESRHNDYDSIPARTWVVGRRA